MTPSPYHRRLLRPVLAGLIALSLVASATAGAPPVGAQATPGPVTELPPTITVTGVGTVSVTPDIARVTVGVSIRDPRLSAAQDEANTVAEALIAIASGNGIPEADIQTDSYNVSVYEEYDDNGNLTGRRTFEVANILTLTIRDLDAAGGILDQLVDAGANVVYGISFDVSDPAPAVAQARTDAVRDARERADAYAAGLDVEIIGIASVSEQTAPAPGTRYDSAGAYDAEQAAESVPVAPGSTDLTVTVQVVFLISG